MADIDEIEFETGQAVGQRGAVDEADLLGSEGIEEQSRPGTHVEKEREERLDEGGNSGGLPESALSAHTEVLQNEPHADLVIGIGKFEGADAETANQVSSEHPSWLSAGISIGSHLVR